MVEPPWGAAVYSASQALEPDGRVVVVPGQMRDLADKFSMILKDCQDQSDN